MRSALLVLAALAVGAAPAAASDYSSLSWRNVGPALAGGRTAGIAGSDADPNLYYFGAAGGGVFKTSDGGLTWRDVWATQRVGAIGAIAIAPSNPRVVWVGTGEPNPRNDASYGDGVYVTHDGAASWSYRGLPHSYAISKILVAPHDPGIVLIGALGNPFVDSADRGVYRTTDGGRSWRKTLYAGPQSGISDLDWDPSGRIVYAGVWQFRRKPWTFVSGGPIDGIYKSTDGGATWHALRGNGLPPSPMGRIGVAVAPSDPRRVYALIQSKRGLLWRSDDGGAHWRMMSADTLIDQRPFYMSRLIVDPTDENHVFFASENLIETHDGGRTFHDVTQAVHQDHHGFWISHDGKRIIEADDGGAPISIDGGKTWDWRFNVDIAQVYHVGYDDRNPYSVCGAMQDDDSYCAPNLSLSPLGLTERDWRDVANDADGVAVWPEPGNPGSVWNVGINELNGQLGIFDLDSRQDYDVTPYVRDTNGRPLAGLPYRFNWEAPLAFAAAPGAGTPVPAYFGANVVFETKDRGRTWQAVSPDLTRNDPSKQQLSGGPINTDISGAEFYDTLLDIGPSTIDSRVLWAGTDDGLVWRTADGGIHWENVTPPGVPPWGRVETVEPSHVSADRAYVVVNRSTMGDLTPYVLATDDGGKTWRTIVAGLPFREPAHVVREDLHNPDVLYAGLEQGAWISFDRGATWESLRLGMPPVAVRDLRIQPSAGDLIAGTHGRGIYILDDLTPLEGLREARAGRVPVFFQPRAAYAWYLWWSGQYGTYDTECCVPAGVFSGTDAPYGALLSYYLPAAAPSASVDVLDRNGKTIRRFAVPAGAGIDRANWDLLERAPIPWNAAREWNKTWTAPMAVPGTYALVLHAGSAQLRRTVEVLPDPRAHWTQAEYVARHDFIAQLDDELSQVDDALNHLDAARSRASAAQRRAIDAVYSQLTSGIVNSEDDQWKPDQLRERITILLGDVNLSQGPPLPPHLREAAEIRTQYESVMAAYRTLAEGLHQ
ncbi:MAG TPA: hypothetical protein VMF61_09010 [Candidatus Acidoferrales bacterium]|nr:hypothetical protein [Candidatus Acidoferrales bacterium]